MSDTHGAPDANEPRPKTVVRTRAESLQDDRPIDASSHLSLPERAVELDLNDLYRRLVESVRDYAIFALDATGHILTWNVGAERLKGYRPEEIIGRHFST